ncbi:MAG: L-aspartate oxidase [Bacillota bacterium]|nr:L-aspartate oxidase [Bacillota bacterium]
MDISTDVLIIGTGVSGLYFALNLNSNLKVTVITKSNIRDCNSYLAQGGISVARNKEDIDVFIEDTLKAGRYKNKRSSVKILAEESLKNIKVLQNYNVDFNMDDGHFNYTREGAHSIKRIVHCDDETGKQVTETLIQEVKKRKNITVIENAYLADIICKDNKCYGGIVLREGVQTNIFSKFTVLASGGIGGLFKNSTNQRTITGNGIAIAIKNNIKIEHLDYIQIHPTSLYEKEKNERKMLISESLRGEGGKLYNINGESFIDELLPRDVVSKAIFEEEKKTNSPFVYLDISNKPDNYLKERFPFIYSECLKRDIDITKDKIPVTPAQHYFMGGIGVDEYSRTSMENLFACGEVSCTGVHGANRLASNSLLEALVFPARAAKIINENIDKMKLSIFDVPILTKTKEDIEIENKKLVINKLNNIAEDSEYELVDC